MAKGNFDGLTKSDLCRATGKTAPTIDNWVKSGLPCEINGTRYSFSLPEVFKWRDAMLRDRIKGGQLEDSDGNQTTKEKEEVKLAIARRIKIETENRVRDGELVEAKDVLQEWTTAITTAKAKILGVPSKIAPQLAPLNKATEIFDILDGELRTIMDELADSGSR